MMRQPKTSYLICATERSGSTLLCEALTLTGVAGAPEEYLCPDHALNWQKRWDIFTSYKEYLAAAMQKTATPNGVFGAKLMWSQFRRFLDEVEQFPNYRDKRFATHDLLQDVFPNLHYVWIRRRDKVRQAVSLARATQTNIWKVRGDTPASEHNEKAVFSFKQIDYIQRKLEIYEVAWRHYFSANNIQPFVVVYEDFVPHYEETSVQILKYLGIPDAESVQFGARSLKRQADEETEQWVQRYLYLKRKSKYYQFISYANKMRMDFLRVKQLKGSIVKDLTGPMFRLKG